MAKQAKQKKRALEWLIQAKQGVGMYRSVDIKCLYPCCLHEILKGLSYLTHIAAPLSRNHKKRVKFNYFQANFVS